MTFCSGCGVLCIEDAKYCHKCGKAVDCQALEAAASVDSSPSCSSNTARSCESSSALQETNKSSSRGFSFSTFRSRKEKERSEFFKTGRSSTNSAKKPRRQGKQSQDVKVNVGVMVMKDGNLSVKRGATLPLTVPEDITAKELLNKAVDKHSRFNNNLVDNNVRHYKLIYGDCKEVKTIPGSDEAFTLKRYKDEIDKPYSRITFYLCSWSDYFDSIISGSSDEELAYTAFEECQTTANKSRCSANLHIKKAENSSSTQSQEYPQFPSSSTGTTSTPILVDDENKAFSAQQQRIQCPICLESYPVHDIQTHADGCSMWLLEEADEPFFDSPKKENTQENDALDEMLCNMSKTEKRKALINEISRVAQKELLQEEPKRITVRRKFIWEDFKHALKRKINPKCKLKVVFAGEPAVDDGGPRRELFSELVSFIRRRFFLDGKPVQSTLAISSGDFKTCGIALGMSILQGGPACNFMSFSVASWFTGSTLSPIENTNPRYKEAAENLGNATTDDEVRSVLMTESVLDVLQELGYAGLPQRETMSTVKDIIQLLCIKDQLDKYLPQLLEIQNGLDTCGILQSIKNYPLLWIEVFQSGSFFALSADNFLEEIDVVYNDSQLKKNKEIDVYKFFCDVIEDVGDARIAELSLDDIIQWLTGSFEIPPLGFPKRFKMQFVHGCAEGCRCRPTVSTCDLLIKMPVHICNVEAMGEILLSAVKDSYGFGNI